jgi:phosphatidylglycerol---prolipoprotein diacylglyceryl transferase
MIPALNIGPFVLPTAALIYIIGAWVCLTLAEKTATWLNLDADDISGLVTVGLIAGIVGARLTFVATYWSSYQNNLLGIIWPINSGFNPFGGLLIGAAAMFFYGRYKQLNFWLTLDALAPIFITGLITVSLADFLGGPGFGTATDLPWGINQFGIRRHPVQIYEIVTGLFALLAWWFYRKRRIFDGQLFLVTIAVYCFGRVFIDAFRANAWLSASGWHVSQILFLIITLVSLILVAVGSKPVDPAIE